MNGLIRLSDFPFRASYAWLVFWVGKCIELTDLFDIMIYAVFYPKNLIATLVNLSIEV